MHRSPARVVAVGVEPCGPARRRCECSERDRDIGIGQASGDSLRPLDETERVVAEALGQPASSHSASSSNR